MEISAKEEYTPEIEEEEKIKDEPSTRPKSRKRVNDSKAHKTKSRDVDKSPNIDDSQSSEIL